jgi:hypothetical protein
LPIPLKTEKEKAMTRLANAEKAGYFPLPPSVTEKILTHIAAPHNGLILDPAAG